MSGEVASRPLSRRRAARAALALIERDGLESFSMRALGRELGVDPMAVYHHVPGKQALFDAIVEEVWGELELPPPGATWQAELGALAAAVRDLLRRHANVLPILATRSSGAQGLRVLEHGVGLLVRAGVPGREALALLSAASSLLVGHALAEVGTPPAGVDDTSSEQVAGIVLGGGERYPALAAAIRDGGLPDWDDVLRTAVDTLVRGVEARLGGTTPGASTPSRGARTSGPSGR
jgi:TetR/AcrR family transcriptional regulator, tetracycline repressor protein